MKFIARSAIGITSLLLACASHSEGIATPPIPVEGPAPVSPPMVHPKAPEPRVWLNPPSRGFSEQLRILTALPGDRVRLHLGAEGARLGAAAYRWIPAQGAYSESSGGGLREIRAPLTPGVYDLEVQIDNRTLRVTDLRLIVLVPASELRQGKLNGYRIGSYPSGSGIYAPPRGFIEVTEQNRDLKISRHFELGHFLTKNQSDTWPKYLVLDLAIIDKLELMADELVDMGVEVEGIHVMSGYRTPEYNGRGSRGRAKRSRHIYGDAADVWVENGGQKGYVGDLNGDGRRSFEDLSVMLQAIDEVERKYPSLVGGAGRYGANRLRSPFLHVDTRGTRARW